MITHPRTKRIGIFVFNGFEPLDVWGPVEAFSIARFVRKNYQSSPPHPFEIALISNECRVGSKKWPDPISSYNGPKVAPDLFRDEAVGAEIDVLLIPGGAGTRGLLEGSNEDVTTLVSWVQTMNAKVELMTSVCTGSALLAKSGVLDGVRATTNHEAFEWVTSFGPRVLWDNVARWVHDGRFVTSAGVSAGTDMAFFLVSLLCGRAVAERAVLDAEYHWHRDPERPIHYPQQATVPRT